MAQSRDIFDGLIAPVGADTFFQKYWEKEPLVITRERPDFYAGLFSMRAVADMIYLSRPEFAGLRTDATPTDMLRGISPEDRAFFFLDDNGIAPLAEEFRRGKSINVMKLEQRWLPVARLCRDLEDVFRHPVTATSFLTPQGRQGLDVHFDGVDGFILQIEGTKHWRIYKPIDELPLGEWTKHFERDDIKEATHDIVLHPGDFLYLPRGWLHEAIADENSSLHITLALSPVRWVDVLKEALTQAARKDVRFRKALPIGLLGTGTITPDLKAAFDDLVADLAENLVLEQSMPAVEYGFVAGLSLLPDSQFLPTERVDAIGVTTRLIKTLGTICRTFEDGEVVGIQFPGGRVSGPKSLKEALDFIVKSDGFSASELPGGLSVRSKLVLVKRLVRDGLLEAAPIEHVIPRAAAE